MAEGAPLLRAYTLIAYRGFESLTLRHKKKDRPLGGLFFMAESEDLVRTLRSTKNHHSDFLDV